ncbi:4'-phosphopantetheinyl transferase family protein [Zophobihabitans entericus]|uniref:4'-phosphopantetheinyl transferase superfamily protein n=1 Tax=Zophobihabitans entericus TaxID=1635327 RepID=A0A6G9I8X9_9GAMM|nr:4'-phosphopantetheinyl transferase superfamily protein [Zophobihabitans entericus]QIQ20678.1 4'-phosphopantetheinyl transferase superfamily protein [Zophobihabitans entericus]
MQSNTLFIQLASLNNYSLTELLSHPRLSPEVIAQTQSFSENRKKQFLACRVILAELLHQYFGQPQLPSIMISDNSRPAFIDTTLPDFNISHSDNHVAVAIATKGQVGLDIEFHRERKNLVKVATSFFSEQENRWLISQPEKLSAFWQLWTLHEAALKLYAKGVWQMKDVEIDIEKQKATAPFITSAYCHYQRLDTTHLAVSCSQIIDNIQFIKI